jgi:cytochrome c-type biogenesis protein CcmF
MEYNGEHLLPGRLGHFFVMLSLIASLVASFSYFKSARSGIDPDKQSWKKLARAAFLIEFVSVIAIFGILYYIISNHLFEYKYAWQHSSRSLEVKYLLACFWEGQEGSFMLWSVWHCVLGLILIRRAKQWEAPVMTVLSFAQFCIATMLAGIYIFNIKIGSSPFVLLRNEMDAPIFSRADYLSFVTDGNDLNPLLQNYWMVIHPPVLFMGFASTIVPFAYAISGLWTKKFGDWTRPALPWALFSAAVLGTGVVMGAMWAYESLTFGGYWAWDPVENASMVPWLVLVGGIHTLLIYRHTGHSLRATHLFFILCFSLILYSTFLTRSGILGDSSVHAFTDLGMNTQLLLFLLIFVMPSFVLFFSRYKEIPHVAKEEETNSREFWMFIGALVLLFSAIFIISFTSIPVFNKIANFFAGKSADPPKQKAAGDDPQFSYNRIMIFVSIVIGILTAITQYLKYKGTHKKYFLKKIMWPTIASIIIASLILLFGNIDYNKYGNFYLAAIWIAIFSSVYAIVANASYIWLGLKGSLKLAGGSVAHVGFACMLLGILISSSKKEILSYNTSGIEVPLGSENPGENLTLVKGMPTQMGKYLVTYESDSMNPKKPLWYYFIHFRSKDGKDQFTLRPNAFVNYKGNQGLMANPDSKHYWDHDVFTYITSLPDPEKNRDTTSFHPRIMKEGDTAFYSNGFFVLEKVVSKDSIPGGSFDPHDVASVATIKVVSKNNSIHTSEALMVNSKGGSFSIPDTVTAESLILRLDNVNGKNIELGVKESNSVMQYVTLKAYKFPYILILWIGTVIMAIGLIMSMVRRIQLNYLKKIS